MCFVFLLIVRCSCRKSAGAKRECVLMCVAREVEIRFDPAMTVVNRYGVQREIS